MNDQHPHAGHAGYDSHSTGSFDTDPLFGSLPGQYDSSPATTYGDGYAPAYDGGQWDTGAHQQASYDAYDAQAHPQAPQGYDTTAGWMPEAGIPAPADATGQWDTTGWDHTGQWAAGDTGAFPTTTFDTTAYATGSFSTPAFETAGYESYAAAETGTYDATAWNTGATPESATYAPEQTSYPSHEQPSVSYESYGTAEFASLDGTGAHDFGSHDLQDSPGSHDHFGTDAAGTAGAYTDVYDEAPETGTEVGGTTPEAVDVTAESAAVEIPAHPVGRSSAPRGGSRGRRRTPAKRSALLTVAVPSACVMSVAGIAAASVGGVGGGEETKDDTTSMAAADLVKPAVANNKLDTQLANLSADAENFADRASRTQERIDLKERQATEKKKREEEAARREALRPKFVLPVQQHGLSATYGQAGVNWMSVHTGIDFPVSYGTPVMAATDGTVRTQWNSAYGNMAIVTAADGTETWYCHLSTTKIRSGSVKAGDVIAYSGNSGNSTGPHLHFEVRPGGGSAIDPMPWLRSHGVNPY
ncbi:M23 family metallopeptidase [Streptomyces sp. JH34]|uniref:M23 family metallopeptidase n=1 Tax=Streptomyces sp. JH34 TaxID=2793633 RepID=UPI0023F69C9C|nr:M23 family metallopeptidase [Streptomyces sp. JH34]MDF6019290.1 M23 family metallopeptidase [Streptomyces sp. JH34]